MALNQYVMVADGGGSGKKKPTLISPDAKAVVDSLHADEDVRSRSTKATTAPATVTPSTTTPAKSSSGSRVSTPAVSTPAVTQQNVDSTAYAQALAAAEAARQNAPIYAGTYDQQIADLAAQIAAREGFKAPGTYDQQIADLYARINGREEFSYDLNGDAFWQMYSDKYTQAAKDAMRDAMGQAAALTGGYGSSYGQAAGQQAYDRRMSELMDIAPELYQMAYQRYQDEGDDLLQKLGLARQMADDEYSKAYRQYTDEGDALLQQLSIARQMSSDEYGRYSDDYDRWRGERAYSDERLAAAQKQQQNNLAFLQSMMALGYTPTAQEIADAGLTSAQYQALASQYATKRSSGGSSKKQEDPQAGKSLTPYEIGIELAKTYGSAATTQYRQGAGFDSLSDLEKRRIYQGISDQLGLSYLDK